MIPIMEAIDLVESSSSGATGWVHGVDRHLGESSSTRGPDLHHSPGSGGGGDQNQESETAPLEMQLKTKMLLCITSSNFPMQNQEENNPTFVSL